MVITIQIMQEFGSMQVTVPFESTEKTLSLVEKIVAASHEFIKEPFEMFRQAEVKVDLLASKLDSVTKLNRITDQMNRSGHEFEVHFVEEDESFHNMLSN